MYSFDGNFKRTPSQSLGGASRQEPKSALLERTQENRRQREEHRKRVSSAVCIQSFYRACKVREKLRCQARVEFDSLCSSIQQGSSILDCDASLARIITPLLFCYRAQLDSTRLTWLCQQLIRDQTLVSKLVTRQCGGVWQLNRLLGLCCSELSMLAVTSQPIAVPLRMLEIYTGVSAYKLPSKDIQHVNGSTNHIQGNAEDHLHKVLLSLITNGYFSCMKSLLVARVPDSLEHSASPPTPMAASILQLIMKPLLAVCDHPDNEELRDSCLQSLCAHMFSTPFSVQLSSFLLPALARHAGFPFTSLLRAILPVQVQSNIPVPANVSLSKPNLQVMSNQQSQSADWGLRGIEPSPWLLFSILNLSIRHLEKLNKTDLHNYLMVLYKLVPELADQRQRMFEEDDSDDEEEMESQEQDGGCFGSVGELRVHCLRLLNLPAHVRGLILAAGGSDDLDTLTAICTVCHTLISHNRLMIHNTRLLYSLAFNPHFLRNLWYACASAWTGSATGGQNRLMGMLARGMSLFPSDLARIVPLLSVFAALFSHLLLSLHDPEFYGGQGRGSASSMPFPVSHLVAMSQALRDVCLGLVELAHPESRPVIKEDYRQAFASVGAHTTALSGEQLHKHLETLAQLFKVVTGLVRHLHARDTRRSFCPEDHWLSTQIAVHAERHSLIFKSGSAFARRPFGALSTLNIHRGEEEGPPLSTTEVRHLTVLTELPFVVPFSERIKIFQKLIHQERFEHQGEMRHFTGGPVINIMVRRNYLYEDAFEKLSVENEPNLKLKMQVQLVNFAGLDEAGIDGGGIAREFMAELVKTAFDPNRGFFRATENKLLYPNPQANLIVENFAPHYYFLGRILGKVIYENMLIELPFASFFLQKLLSRTLAGDVDIHHLQSMDPEMYKNLLSLKHYDGDVCELGLDFTVANNELGEAQVEELKAGGRDLMVDNTNRIEYIYLMADYRLNKQIRQHVNAFRQGLADVINLEWLRMFDHKELQTLISGAEVPIDVDDLKKHTNYSGGYSNDHTVIQCFWSVVSTLTDAQKRALLRFVTSCSRPPLLGFRELHPAFCIHHGGSEVDRLPSASTCMNLLKLPEFKDEDTLRNKLLYAIESAAGFELS